VSQNPKPEAPRRKQIRLLGYDYSQPGRYFITVCALEKACIFGEVHDGYFDPSPAGNIVRECWYELPAHYADVHLDEFVIMPNHIHGIIIFSRPVGAKLKPGVEVSLSRTVSEVVRGFKTFSARRINEMTGATGKPIWQRGYFEHIVRTNKGMAAIRQYIRDNPGAWEKDPENYASPRRGRV
jgi:REP element-mobilizing transposase RayT